MKDVSKVVFFHFASVPGFSRPSALFLFASFAVVVVPLQVEDVGNVTSGGERFDNHLALQGVLFAHIVLMIRGKSMWLI